MRHIYLYHKLILIKILLYYIMGSIYVNNTTGMNKTISNLGSQITVNFNPPILLDPSKISNVTKYWSIVYCHPNVTNRY